MIDSAREFRVGPASAALRRRLGPTAWVILEELLARSSGPAECCRATVSVRSLAAELGLAKDTAARALRRLHSDGLVTGCQLRSTAGTFGTSSYTIVVPDSITFADDRIARVTNATSSQAKPPQRRRPTRSHGPQLALSFDA
jgi:hypothetical protein